MAKTQSHLTKKILLGTHLFIGLLGLAFFKYWDMFYFSMDELFFVLKQDNFLPQWDIILPIGMSFFTFQGLSYGVDVYRNSDNMVKNPLSILLFVAFFPTILSGPILRAKQFVPQLTKYKFSKESYVQGYFMIISGLFKKLFISSYLSEHIVQQVFDMPGDYSYILVIIGVFAYSIQILCD